MSKTSQGFAAAGGAFALWGVFPLYFHLLQHVSALQVIAHRVLWSCLFVLGWISLRGELRPLRASLATLSVVWRLGISAVLITVNWTVYVWAVMNGHVVEASLGYFIGPLVNVLLGILVLSEKLSRAQWTAVALASVGVAYLTVVAGRLPWIALSLAFSFATYGLVRKLVTVESLPGLATETLLLLPLAVGYLLWCESAGTGALGHAGPSIDALLVGSGPLTAIGLFLYAFGTRRLPYATIGLLQYIAPTLQFLCGVWLLHEPFDRARTVGFTIIWAALLIYASEGVLRSRRKPGVFA
ncbi:MAG TPA: EamA family transporter RarD [Steroidobacteraceae bacterium]